MKPTQIVEELKRAAQQLGIQVRMDRGRFRGGYCKVGEEEIIVLNKNHPPDIHALILSECLRGLPVDSVYIRPAARRAMEKIWQKGEQSEMEELDVDV